MEKVTTDSEVIEMKKRFDQLIVNSKYQSTYDLDIYKKLSLKINRQDNNSFIFHDPFQNIRSLAGCQNCFQSFQMDTYGEGCTHDCFYCFAKHTYEAKNQWNQPIPLPADITYLWKVFYEVFETDKANSFRSLLENKVSLRIGSMSDSFMAFEKEIGLTKEFLKILNHYEYPFFIVTKSPLVAQDEYLKLLHPDRAAIHMSIPSVNEKFLKLIEPQAPSAKSRLIALKRLRDAGVWTTARVNPLFPCFSDGHFSIKGGELTDKPELDIFGIDLLHGIQETGTKSVLSGFLSLENKHFNLVDAGLKSQLLKMAASKLDQTSFKYSQPEVNLYYSKIQKYCHGLGIKHTTCYLGSSEDNYHVYKKYNDNINDCCDVIGKVAGHTADTSEISINNIDYQQDEKLGFLTKFAMKLMTFLFKQLRSSEKE